MKELVNFKLKAREKNERMKSTLSIPNAILFKNAKYFCGAENAIISLLLLYEKTHAENESYSNNYYSSKKMSDSLNLTQDTIRKAYYKLIKKRVIIINDGIAELNFINLNLPNFNSTSTAETVEFSEPSTTTETVKFSEPSATTTTATIKNTEPTSTDKIILNSQVVKQTEKPATVKQPEELAQSITKHFEVEEPVKQPEPVKEVKTIEPENKGKFYDYNPNQPAPAQILKSEKIIVNDIEYSLPDFYRWNLKYCKELSEKLIISRYYNNFKIQHPEYKITVEDFEIMFVGIFSSYDSTITDNQMLNIKLEHNKLYPEDLFHINNHIIKLYTKKDIYENKNKKLEYKK